MEGWPEVQMHDAAGINNAHLITPHARRRTVATLLAREAEDKAAASMLGHADLTMTHAAYIERLKEVDDHTAVLGGLAPKLRS